MAPFKLAIAIFCFVYGTWAQAQQHGGGGGGRGGLDFVARADRALTKMEKLGQAEFPGLPFERVRKTIQTMSVLTVQVRQYVQVGIDNQLSVATNSPADQLVTLTYDMPKNTQPPFDDWKLIFDPIEKEFISIHEVLSLTCEDRNAKDDEHRKCLERTGVYTYSAHYKALMLEQQESEMRNVVQTLGSRTPEDMANSAIGSAIVNADDESSISLVCTRKTIENKCVRVQYFYDSTLVHKALTTELDFVELTKQYETLRAALIDQMLDHRKHVKRMKIMPVTHYVFDRGTGLVRMLVRGGVPVGIFATVVLTQANPYSLAVIFVWPMGADLVSLPVRAAIHGVKRWRAARQNRKEEKRLLRLSKALLDGMTGNHQQVIRLKGSDFKVFQSLFNFSAPEANQSGVTP